MKTLIFDPSTSNQELVEDGKTYLSGQKLTVSNERAEELLEAGIPLREPTGDLRKLKRSLVDELAEEAGVENPKDLSSKDAVIAAIKNVSQGSNPPVADAGVGHTNEEA